MSKFDNTISISDVTDLIALLRSGTAVPATVAKQALWLTGCAIEAFDGIPPVVGLMATGDAPSDAELADKLDEVVAESKQVSASADTKAIPSWLLLLWPVLKLLIEQYLSK